MKRIFFTVACLFALIVLNGSVISSPNGYSYVYTYGNATYTNFTLYNRDTINLSFDEPTILHGLNVDTVVNAQTENVSIPINIDLAGYPNGEYIFSLGINDQRFEDTSTRTWNQTPITYTTPALSYGVHTLSITVSNAADSTIIDEEVCFALMERDTVYRNPHGDELHIKHSGVSGFNAIKPVLFVEGFDISINGDSSFMSNLVNRWLPNLQDSEVYLLKLSEPTRDMRDNAMVVLAALRYLRSKQSFNRFVEGSRVFGYSMGGVLARYALAFAEDNNIDHFCTQYISLDAPQRGVALNENVQRLIVDMEDELDDVANDAVDPWLEKLRTTTAKQLLRANTSAQGYTNNGLMYTEGTTSFKEFYSEINPEVRAGYLPGNQVLNAGEEPGFPYKQNNIKSLAFSHGSLAKSGNVNNDQYCMDYDLDVDVLTFLNADYHANAFSYDYQPGSVFEDLRNNPSCHYYYSWSPGIGHYVVSFDLNQHYAPVLVPTKSSLYLQEANVEGSGNADPQFAINNYNNIVADDAHLLNHTYFDKLVYPAPASGTDNDPEWNWRHGELYKPFVQTNITATTTWMNQLSNKSVGFITGTIVDSVPLDVNIKMYMNGSLYGNYSSDSNGNYSIPYLYTNSSNIRLIFSKANRIPTYRDIAVIYSSGAIHYSPITPVSVYNFNYNNIVVTTGQNGSFQSVSAAVSFLNNHISSGVYNGESIKIRIMPGTYYDNINLSDLSSFPIPSLIIEGVGDVTINGNGTGSCISINGGSLSTGIVTEITIKGLKLTNGLQGIYFNDDDGYYMDNDYNPTMRLNVLNCSIYNCASSSNNNYSGGGICFQGAGTIGNCLIENNVIGTSPNSNAFSKVGGLFVDNRTNSTVTIWGNTIKNNHGCVSGGVALTGTGRIELYDNNFENNEVQGGTNELYCVAANDLSVYEAYQAEVYRNVFITNSISIGGSSVGLSSYYNLIQEFDILPIEFLNNTIVNSTPPNLSTSALVIKDRWLGNDITQSINVANNIFSYTNQGGWVRSLNNGSPSISYNIFHNVTADGFQQSLLTNAGNKVGNPYLDENYVPIWNATTMSPCIDNGCPDMFDDDDTPSDIGAYPAIQHINQDYHMPAGGVPKWMSFPVLNRITNGYTVNSNFFEPIIDPVKLGSVTWKDGRYPETSMYYVDDQLINGNQIASSIWGYKVRLQPSVTNLPEIITPGFIQPPNTVINLYAHPIGEPEVANENWIGYFPERSAEPFRAFSSIINYVTAIKTQNWSMKKDPVSGMWLTSSVNPTINYGDMVIVFASQDCSFSWNTSLPVDPKVREKASSFMYTEKMDYTPLYLNLVGLEVLPTEVGVYVNGICKGAVKVEGSFTDLCAYLEEDETITADNCELVLYYASKSAGNIKQACKLKQSDISLVNDGGMQYYTMAINSNAEINPVIPVTALQQNFPNPFNPQTTLSYELAEEGLVKLEIFNIKGQLIKTLVNETRVSGPHRIVWNGTDKYGRNVASGLYNYRLTTKAGSISKKMLLMK